MDWEECYKKRIVKEVKEDKELISSLKNSSENKMKSSDELTMKETTSASKFSLAYDSLRELLEALAIKKGYKIYSHECFTAFLKEILDEKQKGDRFDEIRRIRNEINYYGKDITTGESKEMINKVKNLRKEILYLLNIN